MSCPFDDPTCTQPGPDGPDHNDCGVNTCHECGGHSGAWWICKPCGERLHTQTEGLS